MDTRVCSQNQNTLSYNCTKFIEECASIAHKRLYHVKTIRNLPRLLSTIIYYTVLGQYILLNETIKKDQIFTSVNYITKAHGTLPRREIKTTKNHQNRSVNYTYIFSQLLLSLFFEYLVPYSRFSKRVHLKPSHNTN